jgi:hypothetical protein
MIIKVAWMKLCSGRQLSGSVERTAGTKSYSKQLNFFKLEAEGRPLLLLSKNGSPLLKNNEDQYEAFKL